MLAARMQQRRQEQQQQQTGAGGGGSGGGGGGGGSGGAFSGALGEAQGRFPELWSKWVAKLESKGYLEGMAAGSPEYELHLERAASKFLQSKAITKLRNKEQ